MIKELFDNGVYFNEDTFVAMKTLKSSSVDLLLVDLPYGTTACPWDSVLPLDKLWDEYHRVCKTTAPMIFTCAQPFTTELISSNLSEFSYCWVWEKAKPVGHLRANKQPMKKHEDIAVFLRKQGTYNPQGLVAIEPRTVKRTNKGGVYAGEQASTSTRQKFTNYPNSILRFPAQSGRYHPTQKPVRLFEYLIKTYSNEGDLVLDNCAGSGTTALAAEQANRKWICIEKDPHYFKIACTRIRDEAK